MVLLSSKMSTSVIQRGQRLQFFVVSSFVWNRDRRLLLLEAPAVVRAQWSSYWRDSTIFLRGKWYVMCLLPFIYVCLCDLDTEYSAYLCRPETCFKMLYYSMKIFAHNDI